MERIHSEVAENLKVKEVWVQDRRYIICLNPQDAAKDEADRETMLKALEDKLNKGAKGIVGDRGYRRFLKIDKGAVSLDPAKIEADARFDGKYVLCTNTSLPAAEVALQYKRLYLVEQLFRAAKSLLDTRPIFHQWDATIRGHIFCSFLALVLLDERNGVWQHAAGSWNGRIFAEICWLWLKSKCGRVTSGIISALHFKGWLARSSRP